MTPTRPMEQGRDHGHGLPTLIIMLDTASGSEWETLKVGFFKIRCDVDVLFIFPIGNRICFEFGFPVPHIYLDACAVDG